jgi:hypothetical protein
MTQYLYGAKVQGIQAYIFETNRLKDIGGASELIESLSRSRLKDYFESVAKVRYDQDQLLRNAAGDVLYLFTSRADCEKVVRGFEQYIAKEMPGLTVSQAVVEVKDEAELNDHARGVAHKLQQQRNRPSPPTDAGWMISERARRTGLPGVKYEGENETGLIDRRQQAKRQHTDGRELHKKLMGDEVQLTRADYALDLSDIPKSKENAWLAVVHADGNNLGQLIKELLGKLRPKQIKEGYRRFSETLESATVAAARTAYHTVLAPVVEAEKEAQKKDRIKLPIRPVIIGGDDLTVIMRGEHAVEFTRVYLQAFEKETEGKFKEYARDFGVEQYFENGLTACAGIAFVKPKYPFHYAATLCEELCSWTKKIVKTHDKKRAPSALHFHKVQSSFVSDDYAEVIKQELLTQDKKQLTAGPYYIGANHGHVGHYTVDELMHFVRVLKRSSTPAGPLRDYVGELQMNPVAAAQKLDRIRNLNPKVVEPLQLGNEQIFHSQKTVSKGKEEYTKVTHLYDAIQLANL